MVGPRTTDQVRQARREIHRLAKAIIGPGDRAYDLAICASEIIGNVAELADHWGTRTDSTTGQPCVHFGFNIKDQGGENVPAADYA